MDLAEKLLAIAETLDTDAGPTQPEDESVGISRYCDWLEARVVQLESMIDDFVIAYDLPGDHDEIEQVIRRARELLGAPRKRMTLEALLRRVPDHVTMQIRYARGELSWGPSIDAFRAELEAALPGAYVNWLRP